MDLKENLENINSIENTEDIQSFRYKGFNYWPILRGRMYQKMIQNEKQERQSILAKKVAKLNNSLNLIRSLFTFSYKSTEKKKDYVFFITSGQLTKDNEYYSHEYIDDFSKLFPSGIEYIYINDNLGFNGDIKNKEQWVDLTGKLYRYNIFLKMKSYLFKEEEISNINSDSKMAIIDIYHKSLFYEKELKKYKPKFVFLICFYSKNSFAISLACHRLGINVIDYQHGGQNNYHNMYVGWLNPPKCGYELIPNYFWTWGENSNKRIEKWTANTKKHISFIGGNVSIMRVEDQDNDDQKISVKSSKPKILVSLQSECLLPKWFLGVCEKTKSDFEWLFREHPRNPVSNDLKKTINDISNYKMSEVNSSCKYGLLQAIDVHVTGFSTMAFEALYFNKRTIFINENAKQGYADLIDGEALFYADDSKSFETALNKALNDSSVVKSTYFANKSDLGFDSLSSLGVYLLSLKKV